MSVKPPPAKPETVDDYLSALPDPAQAALRDLRRAIRTAAPDADEILYMGAPTYKVGKSRLVSFGHATKHCAFYVMSARVMERFADQLAGFDTAPTAVRFKPDKPLPQPLVQAIVTARLDEVR